MKKREFKSALILGLGISGESAAQLLIREGCSVLVADRNRSPDLEQRAERLRDAGADVRLEIGDLFSLQEEGDGGGLGSFDVCIISPGIAVTDGWLEPVREHGLPLMSELELGASRCRAPLIAVTGSNGKSTFTKLCGSVLNRGGQRAALAGNYGIPLSSVALDECTFDWVVTEVSSFQLETTVDLAPEIAVLLNIQPDHLDRHNDMETYTGLKARIFDGQKPGSIAVIHDEALDLVREKTRGNPEWRTFGTRPDSDYRYEDGRIFYTRGEQHLSVSLVDSMFSNTVTGLTAAAVFAAASSAGASPEDFREALGEFEPLPHRMEAIGERDGVIFIDDSKGTNLGALCGALQMIDRPVRLIAGGLLKEGGLEKIKEMLAKNTERVYLIGHSGTEMKKAWGQAVDCVLCGNLEAAVHMAWKESAAGDAILLSPGCSSFDQFRDYSDRGAQFQDIVKLLINRKDVNHAN